jgi:hypothetical protein
MAPAGLPQGSSQGLSQGPSQGLSEVHRAGERGGLKLTLKHTQGSRHQSETGAKARAGPGPVAGAGAGYGQTPQDAGGLHSSLLRIPSAALDPDPALSSAGGGYPETDPALACAIARALESAE